MPHTGKPDKPRSVIIRNALPDLFEKVVTDRRKLREEMEAKAAEQQATVTTVEPVVVSEPAAELAAGIMAPQSAETTQETTGKPAAKPKRKPQAARTKTKMTPEPKQPLGTHTEPSEDVIVTAPDPKPEPGPESGPESEITADTAAASEPKPRQPRPNPLKPLLANLRYTASQLRLAQQSVSSGLFSASRPLAAYWPAIVVPLLLAGSQVALLIRPVAGVYTNAAVLATLLGLALWQDRLRQLCLVTALLPTATMVLLSLPITDVFVRTASLYGCLLILGLTYRYLIDFSRSEESEQPEKHFKLGLRGYGRRLPTMIVIGQLMGLLGWLLLKDHYPFAATAAPIVAASAFIFALTEEVVLRGLIQHQAGRVVGIKAAVIMTTILSGALAIGTGTAGWQMPVFGLLLGGVLSAIYARTPNILVTLAVNVTCKLVFLGLLSSVS